MAKVQIKSEKLSPFGGIFSSLVKQHKKNKGKRDFLFPLFVNLTWLY